MVRNRKSLRLDLDFSNSRSHLIDRFSSAQVHCNNMFSKGVKIFQKVECLFKPRLIADWEPEPVGVATVLDDKNPSARFVTVPLNQRVGKAILCRFYFADTWMMMSEISFQSGEYSCKSSRSGKAQRAKEMVWGAGCVEHRGATREDGGGCRSIGRARKVPSTVDSFQADTDGPVQKHNQGNQTLDCRAFFLFDTVACCLWG